MSKHWIYVSIIWQFGKLKYDKLKHLHNKNLLDHIQLFFKCDFKSDEDKNKYSLAPCEDIFKFRHTLLV